MPVLEFEGLLDEILQESEDFAVLSVRELYQKKIIQFAKDEYAFWENGRKDHSDKTKCEKLMLYWIEGAGLSGYAAHSNVKGKKYWSAAFISWIMRQTLKGKDIPFHYSFAHTWYVSRAKYAKVNAEKSYPFWAFDITEMKPQPGDLICNVRETDAFTYGKIGLCNPAEMHCDVVVEIVGKEAHVIGGNTKDDFGGAKGKTVGKKKVALDDRGMIVPRRKAPFIAVIRFLPWI